MKTAQTGNKRTTQNMTQNNSGQSHLPRKNVSIRFLVRNQASKTGNPKINHFLITKSLELHMMRAVNNSPSPGVTKQGSKSGDRQIVNISSKKNVAVFTSGGCHSVWNEINVKWRDGVMKKL